MNRPLWRTWPVDALADLDQALRGVETALVWQQTDVRGSVIILEAAGIEAADALRLHAASIDTALRAVADQRLEVGLERRARMHAGG